VKVKLDENLGTAGADLLTAAGLDVATVVEQQLASATDETIARISTDEDRCLVTLDKDFSDPLRYPPTNYAGIVVIRLPGPFRLSLLEQALGLVIEAARDRDVHGRLWIAEVNRVREYQERTE
jgi:predicted nuclease of predicted toxin-antitoxin system